MTENLDPYAKAFAELENNEKDLGTWAKAFSETSSEEDAKKFYIKLRVEQLDSENRSEAPRGPIAQGKPNQTTPHSSTTTFIDSEDEQGDKHPYKNMIIVSLGLALMYFLFMVLAESKNGIGPIIWSWTAYWIYKREIRGVVMIQKLWVSIATILGIFGVGSWIFSDHAPLLYSYVDLIFSALVSLGLHYWFLQHFQRELPDSYSKWSFQALLPDASGKAGAADYLTERLKAAEHQPELDVRPKSAEGMEQIVGAEESKIHAESTSGQPTEQKRGGEFGLIAALLTIIFVIVLFMLVESDPTPKTASKQVTAPKQLPIQEVTAPETIKAYDPTGDCRYRFSGPRYRGGVLKEERLESSEAYASYKVTHKPTGRYVFVDRAIYRAEAGEKAKTQFFEKYEDMCP